MHIEHLPWLYSALVLAMADTWLEALSMDKPMPHIGIEYYISYANDNSNHLHSLR